MPAALILSSHVAASRVGGTVQVLALAALGVEPILAPTVLFGRHPGWGAPGGAAVPGETFAGVLEGIAAQGPALDLVIAGYFASADQVRTAARAIDALRAGAKPPLIVVDPIMGDDGKGLYVPAEVAGALAKVLVPRAGLLCPNAWELAHLTGQAVTDAASARAAACTLGKAVLVSSVPADNQIGVLYADADETWLATHPRAATAPNGAGDLLTALFAAHRTAGRAPGDALALALGCVVAAIAAAEAGELPIALGALSAPVHVERLG